MSRGNITFVDRGRASLVERGTVFIEQVTRTAVRIGSLIPSDRHRVQGGLGVPPSIGNHCNSARGAETLHRYRGDNARPTTNRFEVEALERAPISRRLFRRCVDHVGQSYIDAVNGLDTRFDLDVEAPNASADQSVLVGSLDRWLVVELDPGRLCRDCTVAQRPSSRMMIQQ